MKTIRSWYANSDLKGDPGIQNEHIERLKKIAQDFENKHNRKLTCSLIFDEMHIREQILWSMNQLRFDGFANYGEDPETGEKIAKEAIVFLLKGIEANFEFPIAYYFVNSLTKYDRRDLIENVIATVTRCGVKITNLTFDGLSANTGMCELLGAQLSVYKKKFQFFIHNPVNQERIYIILDPCHMLKLIRNTFSKRSVFYVGSKQRKIEWRYIEALYQYSLENDFKTHKLTKKHMQWTRNPMNVRLASQTFSYSVADSIQYLMEQGIPEFQGAEATIDFIRRMDKLFNVFNSKYSKEQNVFKRVLCAENKRIVFEFLQDMIQYFKSLQVEEAYFVGKKNPKKQSKSTV